jgi:hypothetical protein
MGLIHDAITKDGAAFKELLGKKNMLTARSEPSQNSVLLDRLLALFKLDRSQIIQQDLGALRESLIQIDDILAQPLMWLNRNRSRIPGAERLPRAGLLPAILGRKRLILERIDELVNVSKIQKIRQLARQVPDKRMRSAILKELDELQAKDEIIQSEYRKLDQAMAAGGWPSPAAPVSARAAGTPDAREAAETASQGTSPKEMPHVP